MELLLSIGRPAPPPVSPWVQRWSHLVPAQAEVLDLACGSGRHARWFAARGHRVTGVDRDTAALSALAETGIDTLNADLEQAPWPLPGRAFGAVIVTHYLWRPLWPAILASVAPGGVLIYETFAAGQGSIGRPSNPDYLLHPGELLDVVRPDLRVVAYEDGFLEEAPRFLQRVAAVREPPEAAQPIRHALAGDGGSVGG